MIELVIDQRRRDIGSFEVGRVLPFARQRMVGPFIFFDHMGPVDLPRGLAREATVPSVLMLLGGAPVGERFIENREAARKPGNLQAAKGRLI